MIRLIILIFALLPYRTNAEPDLYTFQIAAGDNHSCLMSPSLVACWGDNTYRQSTAPSGILESPRQIVAAGHDSCLIDLFHLHCWGVNGRVFKTAPGLHWLAVGVDHVCYLDRPLIGCFRGLNGFGELDPPGTLEAPDQLDAGANATCAIEAGRVICWGEDRFGEANPPPLQDATKVSLGHHHACALLAGGNVRCWGQNDVGQLEVPPLGMVRDISVGLDNACAIDHAGITCWGSDSFGKSSPPPLNGVVAIATGTHHGCAIAIEGVVCWGLDNRGQASPPQDVVDALAGQVVLEVLPPLVDEAPEQVVDEVGTGRSVARGLLQDREIARLLPAIDYLIHL